jgi:hypothetical protein
MRQKIQAYLEAGHAKIHVYPLNTGVLMSGDGPWVIIFFISVDKERLYTVHNKTHRQIKNSDPVNCGTTGS